MRAIYAADMRPVLVVAVTLAAMAGGGCKKKNARPATAPVAADAQPPGPARGPAPAALPAPAEPTIGIASCDQYIRLMAPCPGQDPSTAAELEEARRITAELKDMATDSGGRQKLDDACQVLLDQVKNRHRAPCPADD